MLSSPHKTAVLFATIAVLSLLYHQALLLAHGFKFARQLSSKLVSLLTSFKALVSTSVYSLNNVKAWFIDASDRRWVKYSSDLDDLISWCMV